MKALYKLQKNRNTNQDFAKDERKTEKSLKAKAKDKDNETKKQYNKVESMVIETDSK